MAETTLEEVFLAATKSNLHPDRGGKNGEADTVLSVEDENRNDSSWEENIEEERYEGDERRSQRSTVSSSCQVQNNIGFGQALNFISL